MLETARTGDAVEICVTSSDSDIVWRGLEMTLVCEVDGIGRLEVMHGLPVLQGDPWQLLGAMVSDELYDMLTPDMVTWHIYGFFCDCERDGYHHATAPVCDTPAQIEAALRERMA